MSMLNPASWIVEKYTRDCGNKVLEAYPNMKRIAITLRESHSCGLERLGGVPQ